MLCLYLEENGNNMPTSSNDFKPAIFAHIKHIAWNYLPSGPYRSKILDVGPGIGTYGRELSNFWVDAVEIHKPYIEKYDLNSIYHDVFNCNILDFNYDNYEYIIIGDVLEHIPIEPAQKLIADITRKKIKCLVAVPYICPQDAVDGVESEIHHQDDLTPRLMKSRYPELEVFLDNNRVAGGYAYYTNYYTFKF